MSDGQYDLKAFQETQEYGQYLVSQHSARNAMFDAMEAMYLLQWDEEQSIKKRAGQHVRMTISPDARNALKGAIRLLIAGDPIFHMPFSKDAPGAGEDAEKIENFVTTMWRAAGRVRGDPIHFDIVRSALLFDEFHISVNSTRDMVVHAAGSSKAYLARMEAIAERTPYLFDVSDPRTGYPEFSDGGLRSFYRETEITIGQVLDQFGKDARRALGANADERSRYSSVILCDLWELDRRTVWIKGGQSPVVQEAHNLVDIPWVAHRVEGSKLFDKPEEQREPFLYTLWKSGFWNRENLIFTVAFTQLFGLGLNPMFIEKLNPQGAGVKIDMSRPGGKVTVPYGGDFAPMVNKGIIDPAVFQMLQLADDRTTQSTIYRQVLGEPMEGNSPFATVSLLSQAGRQPLIVSQRKGSWGIADAAQLALRFLKDEGKQGKTIYEGETSELDPAGIPEFIDLQAKLDIDLPQDKLGAANIAGMVVDKKLASRRWAREELLRIQNSDEMDREIWDEAASELLFGEGIKQLLTQMQQQQAQKQPGLMSGQSMPGQMPAGAPMPGGMPPDMGEPGGEPGGPGFDPSAGGMPAAMAGQMPMQGPGMPANGQGEISLPEGGGL